MKSNEISKGPFTPSVSVNAAVMLAILFSLKTMESLQNGFAAHFQATPLFSMRTKLQASLQSSRSVDADTWCKRTLKGMKMYFPKKNIKCISFMCNSCLSTVTYTVRVLCLFHNNSVDYSWYIYCWGYCTIYRYQTTATICWLLELTYWLNYWCLHCTVKYLKYAPVESIICWQFW